jgi:predicted cupin superfamily sugar epimerase
MSEKIASIIKNLELQPHPEGGYFKETYRSQGTVDEKSLGGKYRGERNYSTCIYFLLTSDDFSALHRIKQDEIWHYYDGSPIRLHMINEQGEHSIQMIGKDFEKDQVPQYVVPGGCWFAAQVIEPDNYSLVGCTVSPGFSFEDFELVPRAALIQLFPQHEQVVTALTHH